MPDYDFYHGLYSGQQVDSAVSRALVGGQLDQDIAAIRAAVGSPLVATTAAEMTNINKIYVYTGSEAGYSTGHWYYYEGGSWQDGGLYNSAAADSAMSDSSTNAVQNKVIKEYVDDVRTDLGSDIADARTDLGADILAEQTRAENVEALKAPLASPALTGTPTAPTAPAGTSSTQIATTAYADNAVAVEKARAEAVEATKADQSFAEYILLREEEDRQILFGSIVEAAEDEYPELRSAPIHNAITIGQSVYPRMDRTRMAIDAIRGRTVAFNQLIPTHLAYSITSGDTTGLTIDVTDGYINITGTAQDEVIVAINPPGGIIPANHVCYMVCDGWNGFAWGRIGFGYVTNSDWLNKHPVDFGVSARIKLVSGTTYNIHARFSGYDLTQIYGTTIADYILTTGTAYVRQRLDLDYYAYNAGELVVPVVSGVSVVGFNLFDKSTATNNKRMNNGSEINDNGRAHSDYISVNANTEYYFANCLKSTVGECVDFYDANKQFIIRYYSSTGILQITIPQSAAYAIVNYEIANVDSVCVNISNASLNGQYRPYVAPTTLSLPSTRLDGVGTAQDYIECVEVGENDYSLHLHKVMGEVDLGTLSWSRTQFGEIFAFHSAVSNKAYPSANMICTKYVTQSATSWSTLANGCIQGASAGTSIAIRDDSYSDAATFKTAMNGVMLAYELATPTETVIASHLTLADISAIAENGGIISVENSNGHIVQPDFVADVVISRSAS